MDIEAIIMLTKEQISFALKFENKQIKIETLLKLGEERGGFWDDNIRHYYSVLTTTTTS